MMHIPRIAGLGDEPHADPLLGLHEALVHRTDGEQHRNRRARLVGVAVADHENRGAAAYRRDGVARERLECALQLLGACRGLPHGAQRCRVRAAPAAPPGAPQGRHFLRQEDRVLDAQQCLAARPLREH